MTDKAEETDLKNQDKEKIPVELSRAPRIYEEIQKSWSGWKGLRRFGILSIVVAFYWYSYRLAKVDPLRLWQGLPKMGRWLTKAWPPSTDDLNTLLLRALETIAMATIGTTIAMILALVVCVFASRNLAPNVFVYYIARTILNILRGVDSFVFAILFVAAVGLGPFAGVLGIGLHTWGSMAKLYAEAIETAEQGPLEAARLSGASQIKVIVYALLPDIMPALISVTLFWWEFNVRASTALGIVGAGGIGQDLKNSMDLLDFPSLLTILLIILTMVTGIDRISALLRRKLI